MYRQNLVALALFVDCGNLRYSGTRESVHITSWLIEVHNPISVERAMLFEEEDMVKVCDQSGKVENQGMLPTHMILIATLMYCACEESVFMTLER